MKNSRSSTPDDGGVLESQRCQQKLNCADLVHRFSFDNNTLLPRVPKQLPVRQPCIVSTFLSKGDIHKQIHADESPLFLAISSASNRWTSGGREADLSVVRLVLQAHPPRLAPLHCRMGCTAVVLLLLNWGALTFTSPAFSSRYPHYTY